VHDPRGSKQKQVKRIHGLLSTSRLPATYERFLRMRYGISLEPYEELQQLEMPQKTAKVIHALEAMLVGLAEDSEDRNPSNLKKSLIIGKLRNSKDQDLP